MLGIAAYIGLLHGFILLGRRVGGWAITRLKLYKKIHPPKPTTSIPEEILQAATGQLKSFVKYAKLSPEITDDYRIFTLKIYLNSILCILALGLGLFFATGIRIPVGNYGQELNLEFENPLIIIILVIAIISVDFFLPLNKFTKLRQRFRFSPTQSLLHDTRNPILFLRSFHQDSPEPALEVDTLNADLGHKDSTEELLVATLQQMGPVVAVGRPGETLPQLGAIRVYFSDDVWKERVLELMALSRFVIIQAGHSQGTEWEMLTVKNKLQPQKVIFSFVHWQVQSRNAAQLDYDIFKMQISRLYDQILPKEIGNSLFMYYDRDWKPQFVEGGVSSESLSRALSIILKETGNMNLA